MPPGHWKVEHNCPQCGGPIALTEDDRVLTCDYCRVRLYVASDGGPTRYALPPRNVDVGEIVMVPYWRVRGQVFRSEGLRLASRLLDGTRLACPAPGLPPTLGVRPQAMSLRFASAELAGRFVTPTIPPVFSATRRTRTPGARVLGDPAFDIPLLPARINRLPAGQAGRRRLRCRWQPADRHARCRFLAPAGRRDRRGAAGRPLSTDALSLVFVATRLPR